MDTLIAMAAILVFIVTILLLLAGLILAPWHIHLMILLVGLFTIRRLLTQNALRSTLQDAAGLSPDPVAPSSVAASSAAPPDYLDHQDHPSDLSYRGAHYAHPQETEAIAADHLPEMHGKYRGSPWQKAADSAELPPEVAKLKVIKYRGSFWKPPIDAR